VHPLFLFRLHAARRQRRRCPLFLSPPRSFFPQIRAAKRIGEGSLFRKGMSTSLTSAGSLAPRSVTAAGPPLLFPAHRETKRPPWMPRATTLDRNVAPSLGCSAPHCRTSTARPGHGRRGSPPSIQTTRPPNPILVL
jgi:hypothetical protein